MVHCRLIYPLLALCSVLGCDPHRSVEPIVLSSQGITDGSDDSGHPEVGLLLIGASGGVAKTICTATVVGAHTVLTAAHCCHTTETNLFQLQKKLYTVSKVIPHPSWESSQPYTHDIGLVMLTDTVPTAPVTIGTIVPKAEMPVTLVGFGRTAEDIKDSGKKRKANNTIDSAKTQYFTIAGTGGDMGNTCQGDSGGPVYTKSGGQEVVIGVISSSELECGVTSYHVSVNNYLSWLKSQSGEINKVDQKNPVVTITAPKAGATVSPSVSLAVNATDDQGIASVEAFVDDRSQSKLTKAPYTFSLSLSPGLRTLKAVAKDSAGNTGSAQVLVTVTSGSLVDSSTSDVGANGDGAGDPGRGEEGCTFFRPSLPVSPIWPGPLLLLFSFMLLRLLPRRK